MNALPTLPLELSLLIAEHAAASEAPTRVGWVAALCRVCKALHRAATPILYAHMVVTRENIHLLVELAAESPFLLAYVRSVTFSGSRLYHHHDVQRIVRAMPYLRALKGSVYNLRIVLEDNKDLCWSSMFVTDPTGELVLGIPGLQRWYHIATHLHIRITVRNALIGFVQDMKIEYLILDVVVEGPKDESQWSLYTRDFLQQLEGAGLPNSLRSLRRILFRTRAYSSFDMAPLHIALAKWAKEMCDPRIWIDDSAAAPWLDETAFEEANMKDAVAGDNLWFTGRQIYSVPLSLRKA